MLPNIPRITVGIDGAAEITGLGRTSIFRLMKEGKLPRRRVCGRTLIMVDDLRSLIEQAAA